MNFDLAQVLAELAAGILEPARLKWKPGASACVVLTSGGYPGKFVSGKRISGLTDTTRVNGVQIFHAGTLRRRESIVTSGGRVLGVTAASDSLEGALAKVYQASAKISFEGMHYRKDIGAQAGRMHVAGD
jgi:phosphoribosylamine--glycine ligase